MPSKQVSYSDLYSDKKPKKNPVGETKRKKQQNIDSKQKPVKVGRYSDIQIIVMHILNFIGHLKALD
jgi:hypothetical protein